MAGGRPLAVIGSVALVLVAISCRDTAQPARGPQVSIRGTTWEVELALTPERRAQGLGDRRGLASDHGMLFVFDHPENQSFWMRRCLIGLDIAFISSDLRIVRIYTMYPQPGVPDSRLKTYDSVEPVQYALEVSAGSLQLAGAKVGDVVTFSGDIPRPGKPSSTTAATSQAGDR